MRKMYKKIISFVLVIMMSITMLVPSFASSGINVYLDGEKIQFDVAPLLVDGRTMVPMRAIFEKLGAVVYWDNDTRTAVANKSSVNVSIAIDNTTLYKNGEPIILDVPAQLNGGRTLVPLRAVSEAFDCDVQWNGDTQTVNIYSKDTSSGLNQTEESTYIEPTQKYAFNQLKNFIVNNSNDSMNGKPMYSETYERDYSYEKYSLDYDEAADSITLMSISAKHHLSFTCISLYPDKNTCFSMWTYYSDSNKTYIPDFNGKFYINPKDYNLNSIISFYEIEGDTSHTSFYKEMALINSLEVLDFTDYICKRYLSDKNVSLSDFGFTVPADGYTSVVFVR